MSFEINQAQLDAVINEFEILKKNMSTQVEPDTKAFMGEIQDVAIELTHYISHALQSGWQLISSNTGDRVIVTLYNPVDYAKQEFERGGIKESVGTPHDIRPAIQDETMGSIEQKVFASITKGLKR